MIGASIIRLVQDLRARGVQLMARGDRIAFEAPRDAFADDLKALVVRHREEVLALLREESRACVQCGDRTASVMLAMEPGGDGAPWYLCSVCHRGGR